MFSYQPPYLFSMHINEMLGVTQHDWEQFEHVVLPEQTSTAMHYKLLIRFTCLA